jgi:hypothetical protein
LIRFTVFYSIELLIIGSENGHTAVESEEVRTTLSVRAITILLGLATVTGEEELEIARDLFPNESDGGASRLLNLFSKLKDKVSGMFLISR